MTNDESSSNGLQCGFSILCGFSRGLKKLWGSVKQNKDPCLAYDFWCTHYTSQSLLNTRKFGSSLPIMHCFFRTHDSNDIALFSVGPEILRPKTCTRDGALKATHIFFITLIIEIKDMQKNFIKSKYVIKIIIKPKIYSK